MYWPLPLQAVLVTLGSYAVGSIPFALIASHILGKGDIRNHGSGNAGATNVFRVLGWKAAVFVLVADFLKGFLPVFFVLRMTSGARPLIPMLALSAIVIGHAFPLWAGFRGGKGVACAAGGITAIFPLAAPVCLGVFIIVLAAGSYVSLASLAAAWSLPLLYVLVTRFGPSGRSTETLIFFLLVATGISFLHRKNIGRLIRGEEARFRFRKPRPPEQT